jgi:hypothetical protein
VGACRELKEWNDEEENVTPPAQNGKWRRQEIAASFDS